jgi:hypothetical protein
MPDLYEEHMNSVNLEMLSLWEKGYLNIDLLSNDPHITLSEKALDPEELSKLSVNDLWSINEIKRLMNQK